MTDVPPGVTENQAGLPNARDSASHHSASDVDLELAHPSADNADDEEEEEFIYPSVRIPGTEVPLLKSQSQPSAAQLESLFAAASSGDLHMLKKLFKNARDSGVEPFSFANHATSRTGSTALHTAASRGYIDIVTWLVEDCGAIPDLEDREGETSLHRAALSGHLSIVQYLSRSGADIHARDSDGWTALHNACSKGYLDIVRWLCERGVTEEVKGPRGIDARSNEGWTPLMNASSKGHLPIVLYLIKQGADPLVRNKWGETAYDTAAAVFQVWICELLQQAEAEQWHNTGIPYNALAVHTTLPIIVHEYQKLDARLKTLAKNGGRPIFSASGLGKRGRRPPYELKFPNLEIVTDATVVPAWRSDIQLPLRNSPWIFSTPGRSESQPSENIERSHFWQSEWFLDVTHPKVDAREGWQYAHDFGDPDKQWTAERPQSLERLLNDVTTSGGAAHSWVRRRRWVRIMRRRIDIPPLPFLQSNGCMYELASDGTLVLYTEQANEEPHADGGQELSTMAPSFLVNAKDYVARARYLVGNQISDAEVGYPSSTAAESRRSITKLERATTELRQGILGDEDSDRKTQAYVLLNVYGRELERLRLAATARGWSTVDDEDDDSSDEEFHYPGASIEDRRPISRVSSITDTLTQPGLSRTSTDLTSQLSQAPDFRVPTREAPQAGLISRRTSSSSLQSARWEKDEYVPSCRGCQNRFGIFTRRHCRKCGRIFCDSCSAFRVLLDPSEVVYEPEYRKASGSGSSGLQRVCKGCYEEVTAPASIQDKTIIIKPLVVDPKQLVTSRAQGSNPQVGDLSTCPVCDFRLEKIGNTQEQEDHIRKCLKGASKYLSYRLRAESTLIGIECVLCSEKFTKGAGVARLSCLCSFHDACLSGWLQRGKFCPEHSR
ncbi:hypothetical protein M378DRAFT_121217 [Amanita muscaria Koide BX008]|uniref:Uncharacterized protein n=1 Tax=Amanita muscaria (strain Koide BX008) TaxID=946122 RepID=A0A0C2XF98_AMAMK|nr:hypothetical protein M378DRAFT_121217 [Amanita muscaria Koide BX008]